MYEASDPVYENEVDRCPRSEESAAVQRQHGVERVYVEWFRGDNRMFETRILYHNNTE